MDFIWNKIQFVITDLGGGKLGEKIPMHVHAKGCYELHFITEGKGTLIADGREIELKKNDFFITGPNIRHSQNYDEQSPIEDVLVYFFLSSIPQNLIHLYLAEFLPTYEHDPDTFLPPLF